MKLLTSFIQPNAFVACGDRFIIITVPDDLKLNGIVGSGIIPHFVVMVRF